jgi:hypothetical protein
MCAAASVASSPVETRVDLIKHEGELVLVEQVVLEGAPCGTPSLIQVLDGLDRTIVQEGLCLGHSLQSVALSTANGSIRLKGGRNPGEHLRRAGMPNITQRARSERRTWSIHPATICRGWGVTFRLCRLPRARWRRTPTSPTRLATLQPQPSRPADRRAELLSPPMPTLPPPHIGTQMGWQCTSHGQSCCNASPPQGGQGDAGLTNTHKKRPEAGPSA